MLSKSINSNDINFGGMLVISSDTDPPLRLLEELAVN